MESSDRVKDAVPPWGETGGMTNSVFTPEVLLLDDSSDGPQGLSSMEIFPKTVARLLLPNWKGPMPV